MSSDSHSHPTIHTHTGSERPLRTAIGGRPSLLMSSALHRLGWALLLLMVMWLAVLWALSA